MSDNKLILPCDVGNVSDGYHTFKELYEHRCTLMVALMYSNKEFSWWSRLHADESAFDGWIIVGMTLLGHQITYHIPDKWVEMLEGISELKKAPVWDGHTSQDVLSRLKTWIADGLEATP